MSVKLITKHEIRELGEKWMSSLVYSHTKDAKKFPGDDCHFPSASNKLVYI